jgi:bifunctional non-homologous end joining protein LigD
MLRMRDLIELNGDDLRPDSLEVRKATLASIVAKASAGIRFNEHLEGDGPTVFAHACKLGPKDCLEVKGFSLPFRSLARLDGTSAAGMR